MTDEFDVQTIANKFAAAASRKNQKQYDKLIEQYDINQASGVWTVLNVLMMDGKVEEVRQLIEWGADPLSHEHNYYAAAASGMFEIIELHASSSVNLSKALGFASYSLQHDELGQRCSHPEIVRFLLQRGGDPNEFHALHNAAIAGDPKSVQCLVKTGANVDLAIAPSLGMRSTVLQCACEREKRRHVECCRLLLDAGCDVNAYGMSNEEHEFDPPPIVLAKHPEIIKLLVNRGASLNDSASAGALFAAVKEFHPQALRTLLKMGADPRLEFPDDYNFKIYCWGAEGSTPLEYANTVSGRDASQRMALKEIKALLTAALDGEMLPEPVPITGKQAIAQLKAAIKESGLKFALQKKIAEETVTSVEESLGCELPQDVKEVYQSCDGQKPNSVPIVWDDDSEDRIGRWLPMEEAIEARKMWMSLLEENPEWSEHVHSIDGLQNGWWRPEWLPIATDGSGDCFFIDLSTSSDDRGQVVYMSHETGPDRIVANSLAEWISDCATELT